MARVKKGKIRIDRHKIKITGRFDPDPWVDSQGAGGQGIQMGAR